MLLPLLGALINGLLGAPLQRALGKRSISLIACGSVMVSFLISLWAFRELLALEAEKRFLVDRLYSWISLGSLTK